MLTHFYAIDSVADKICSLCAETKDKERVVDTDQTVKSLQAVFEEFQDCSRFVFMDYKDWRAKQRNVKPKQRLQGSPSPPVIETCWEQTMLLELCKNACTGKRLERVLQDHKVKDLILAMWVPLNREARDRKYQFDRLGMLLGIDILLQVGEEEIKATAPEWQDYTLRTFWRSLQELHHFTAFDVRLRESVVLKSLDAVIESDQRATWSAWAGLIGSMATCKDGEPPLTKETRRKATEKLLQVADGKPFVEDQRWIPFVYEAEWAMCQLCSDLPDEVDAFLEKVEGAVYNHVKANEYSLELRALRQDQRNKQKPATSKYW